MGVDHECVIFHPVSGFPQISLHQRKSLIYSQSLYRNLVAWNAKCHRSCLTSVSNRKPELTINKPRQGQDTDRFILMGVNVIG